MQQELSSFIGVGYGKNRAVRLSRGRFLCFNDADDISSPNRLALQLAACLNASDPDNCFVGSNFTRSPANSTERFTRWACSLSNDQLYKQVLMALPIKIQFFQDLHQSREYIDSAHLVS
jgi:hypothetical protein